MPKPSKGAEFVGYRSKMKAARKAKKAAKADSAKQVSDFIASVAQSLALAKEAATKAGEVFQYIVGYIGGKPVFTVEGSHLHQQAKAHISDACRLITEQPFVKVAVDLGKVIGKTNCVVTTEADKTFETTRPGRKCKSRFVRNRQPEECKLLTVIAAQQPNGAFMLYTSYVGEVAPREVGDLEFAVANCKPEAKEQLEKDLAEAKAFWSTHALTEDALKD